MLSHGNDYVHTVRYICIDVHICAGALEGSPTRTHTVTAVIVVKLTTIVIPPAIYALPRIVKQKEPKGPRGADGWKNRE